MPTKRSGASWVIAQIASFCIELTRGPVSWSSQWKYWGGAMARTWTSIPWRSMSASRAPVSTNCAVWVARSSRLYLVLSSGWTCIRGSYSGRKSGAATSAAAGTSTWVWMSMVG